ncbi:reo_6 protein [Plakobranchus ocellatus]|uniref:Reo_6 protein n=1 Tax=Plakobranchus ocellatus TaxID=259542 RepID=A0AAV4BSU1_9GAST|nr:reo_6 protein [Plakobranchus ocellatus]
MAPIYGDVLCRALVICVVFSLFWTNTNGMYVKYSREELLSLDPEHSHVDHVGISISSTIFAGLTKPTNSQDNTQQAGNRAKRSRGRRAGLLVKSRRVNNIKRPPLPTLLLSNENRLFNKTDELFSRLQSQKDFRNCHALCLTEIWLNNSHPDGLVKPPGFSIYRQDRDKTTTGKQDGGGVCFMILDKWCTNVKVISSGCNKNLEHLTIKCRPFYLPKQFSSLTLTAVYIHPAADTKEALDHLRDIISNSENKDPDTHSIICGDFNQANLKTVLPNFYQHVTCPTRGINTLGHCYSKMNSAYKAIERSGLGNSDHSCVQLLPKYIQKV